MYRFQLIIIIIFYLFCSAVSAKDSIYKECTGPYKDIKPTQQEISNIIESHYKYLLEKYPKSKKLLEGKHTNWINAVLNPTLQTLPQQGLPAKMANLCGADLWVAHLQKAYLFGANFQNANLGGAKLQGSNLGKANLQEANLWSANLQDTHLARANLQKTNLREANLQGANLATANLVGADLEDANLQDAYLENTILKEANLTSANLQGADLIGAKLQNADLFSAYLQSAHFNLANLQDADLSYAALQKADLRRAVLKNANLLEANLQEANLSEANLTNANLKNAILIDAILEETDLHSASFINTDITNSTFMPVSAPDSGSLAGMKGILTVNLYKKNIGPVYSVNTFSNISGLVLLRNKLKEAGLRDLERQTTFKIEQWKTDNVSFAEKWLKKVFFEYTTGYSLYYDRPLKIIILLMFVFMLIYIAPIASKQSEDSGIFQIWPKDEREINVTKTNDLKIIGFAFYFSLLSAFNIGWRDLNVGAWISRLQPRANTLQAKGWVRTVSGIQSLISVYLFAMWVLTYFGRPFD